MYRIDISTVSGWTKYNDNSVEPRTVDTYCPHCGKLTSLQPRDRAYDVLRNTNMFTLRCPGCRGDSYLWIIGDGKDLYLRPKPKIIRQPIEGAELMPSAVRQAYRDTVDVYNAGVWSATATATRRTLEGIVSNLLPEEKGPLAQQIRKLGESSSIDLSQPLITLSNSVRQGGNIGAHFDLERVPDESTAEAMLDLIEYLIEYLYTLPEMIEELDLRIQRLGNTEDEQVSE